jgi:hypothetical protein
MCTHHQAQRRQPDSCSCDQRSPLALHPASACAHPKVRRCHHPHLAGKRKVSCLSCRTLITKRQAVHQQDAVHVQLSPGVNKAATQLTCCKEVLGPGLQAQRVDLLLVQGDLLHMATREGWPCQCCSCATGCKLLRYPQILCSMQPHVWGTVTADCNFCTLKGLIVGSISPQQVWRRRPGGCPPLPGRHPCLRGKQCCHLLSRPWQSTRHPLPTAAAACRTSGGEGACNETQMWGAWTNVPASAHSPAAGAPAAGSGRLVRTTHLECASCARVHAAQ